MSSKDRSFHFDPNFRWGTATSAHQVEGHQRNDWWAAEIQGGYVYENQRSGAACDWWHLAEQDFDRMQEMGLNAHRLSIEWSRVQPHPDTWDEAALARYREMIEGLHARGIEPMVTLHHFTLPVWVAAEGGWENRQSPQWFESYVRKVVSALGDKVNLWCTINEPMVQIAQGYLIGSWPPGKSSPRLAREVGRNLVRAHAAAYHAIHGIQREARVGLAKHMVVWRPHRFWMPIDQILSRIVNRISNHVILSAVTDGVIRIPLLRPYRIPEAARTLDWLGVNYYQRFRVGIKIWDGLRSLMPGRQIDLLHFGTNPGVQTGPGLWGEIHPRGLFESLRSVVRYDVPIYITENGIPDEHDQYRPSFIVAHLHQAWQAIQSGVDLRGYYHWSLVDNFEWSEGYDPRFRFGLVGVDTQTQKRTPKTSAELYSRICRERGVSQDIVRQYAPEILGSLFPNLRSP